MRDIPGSQEFVAKKQQSQKARKAEQKRLLEQAPPKPEPFYHRKMSEKEREAEKKGLAAAAAELAW